MPTIDLNTIETALVQIFDVDSLQFDDNRCLEHTLPSGMPVWVRWFEDAGNLLVSLPIGELSVDQIDRRAALLLMANNGGHFTAGGALGLDPDTNEVSLSRSFAVNGKHDDPRASLGSLPTFCFLAPGLKPWLEAINSLVLDSETGELTTPDLTSDEALAAGEEFLEQASENIVIPQWDEESRVMFSEFANKALGQLGIGPRELDEDMAITLAENDVPMQVRLDAVLQELVVTALLGTVEAEQITTRSAEWLASNLYLADSGGGGICLTHQDPFFLTLSYTTPVETLLPDPANLANLLGSFRASAAALQERFLPLEPITADDFNDAPNFDQLV